MIAGKKFFQIFYIIVLIFMFLPAFHFPLGDRTYRVLFLFMIPFWIVVISIKQTSFINDLYFLYKKTPFKYLCLFALYILIQTAILAILKIYPPLRAFIYLIQLIFLYIIPSYLLTAYIVPKYYSIEKLIKFFYAILLFIFLFGLFEYIGKAFHIAPIVAVQQFIDNAHYGELVDREMTVYERLQSVFEEPAWFGGFLFLFFPIIYRLSDIKQKIFKNDFVNYFAKKSLVPLAWICLLFTFSPLWLIFCIIQTLWIFRKQIIKKMFTFNSTTMIIYAVLAVFLTALIILLFSPAADKLQYNTLKRIIDTVISFTSFNTFIEVEPSLGSRILSYMHQVKLFVQHPVLGVGYGNSIYQLTPVFVNTDLPLTLEIINKLKRSFLSGIMNVNVAVLYQSLSELGIVGTFFLYLYLFKNVKCLKKIKKAINNETVYQFTCGVEGSLWAFIFATLYGTTLNNPQWWFLFGLSASCIIYYLKNVQKNIQD